tara:strand:- start:80856 stop:82358 length:1503 start_codon:yes stop_codon:yes gene_type:complete
MKIDLIKQFNLPTYIKNKSFAEASKLINNKFKDREDSVSSATKDALLQRLADAQEYTKMQDNLARNAEQVPDMMNGEIPEGAGQFAGGGSMGGYNDKFAYDPELQNMMKTNEGIKSAVGHAIPVAGLFQQVEKGGKALGQAIGGDTGGDIAGGILDPFTGQMETFKNENSTNFEKGASLALPFLSGIIASKGRKRGETIAENKNALVANSQYNNDFAKGGYTNQYVGGGSLDDIFKVTSQAQNQLGSASNNIGNSWLTQRTRPDAVKDITAVDQTKLGKQIGGVTDWLGQNYGNIASYAPLVGNAIQLSKLKKPNTERGSRLTNTYTPQRFDTNSLINRINQNDINSALTESSGGNLGALRSNILAANLNKTTAISDGMIKGDQINRDENRFKFQSDLNRDNTNVRLDESYIDRKARDKGAYNTAKSKLTTAMYEDIGKVGQDVVNKKLVRDTFGYTWDGKYYVGKDGKKYSPKEVALQKAEYDKVTKDNSSAYGGYLKK